MQWSKGWSVGMLVLCCATLSCARLRPASSRPVIPPAVAQPRPAPRPVPRPVPRPAPRPVLRPDPAVRQVQGILQENGYDPGPLDGLMGPQTRQALRQFQRDHNLPASGQLDAATQAALLQPPAY